MSGVSFLIPYGSVKIMSEVLKLQSNGCAKHLLPLSNPHWVAVSKVWVNVRHTLKKSAMHEFETSY
jgi:hypothetical protein